MVWVALAGPATNIALALVAAGRISSSGLGACEAAGKWSRTISKIALVIKVVLAVSTCFRFLRWTRGVAVGLLPRCWLGPFPCASPLGADPNRNF